MNQKHRKRKNKIIELFLGIIGGIFAIIAGIPLIQEATLYLNQSPHGIIELLLGLIPGIFGIIGLITIIISISPNKRFSSLISMTSGIIVVIFSYTLVLFSKRIDLLNGGLAYLGIIGGIILFIAGLLRITRT